MHSVLRLRQLSASERRLLLLALLLLPLIRAATSLFGLQRTLSALRTLIPRRRAPVHGEEAVQQASDVARIVRIAATRGPYRATCLPQALTVWWLLRRRGIAAVFQIGVRKEGEALLAHAWVEYQGAVLGDDGNRGHGFTPFEGTEKALIGRAL